MGFPTLSDRPRAWVDSASARRAVLSALGAALLLALLLALAAPAAAQGFRRWDPADTAAAPKRLSETGFYADIARQAVTPEAHFFDVNAPLWSDGSHKARWVALPPGASIGFSERKDYFDYPAGTVFVKNFALDTVPGDTATRLLWETRVLVLKEEPYGDPARPEAKQDVWYGYSYRWRRDQRDADLVGEDGENASLAVYSRGRGAAPTLKKWRFPSRSECQRCHHNGEADTLRARSVLGFFTAQLNRPSPARPAVNQLEDFFSRGLLRGNRPASFDASPRWHGLDARGPGATLEARARSYLAANCSGCHSRNGFTFGPHVSGPDFDWDGSVARMELRNQVPNRDFNLAEVAPAAPADDPVLGVYYVTPGYPQKSTVLHRLGARNAEPPGEISSFDPHAEQMPPLASYEVHTEAMAVLEEWVRTLQPLGTALRGRAGATPAAGPSLRDGLLHLPEGIDGRSPPLVAGLDGRRVPLVRVGPGRYRPARELPAGVYLVRAAGRLWRLSAW